MHPANVFIKCLRNARLLDAMSTEKRKNRIQFPPTLHKCLSTTHFPLHNPRMERPWLRHSRQNCRSRAIDDYPICLDDLDFCKATAPYCKYRNGVYKDTSFLSISSINVHVIYGKKLSAKLQSLRFDGKEVISVMLFLTVKGVTPGTTD